MIERLLELMKKYNINAKQLTCELEISNSAITDWKKGKSKPSTDAIIKLSQFFNVSTDYLLLGKEKSPSAELTADEHELLTYYKKLNFIQKGIVIGRAEALAEASMKELTDDGQQAETIYIEMYNLPVSAGAGVYLDGYDKDMIEVESTNLTEKANFALKISGNSMEPKYRDGDIVLISSQPCIDIGDVGIFILNGEGYIKQFGGDRLISLNKRYDDVIINEDDDFYCKGKVIGKL